MLHLLDSFLTAFHIAFVVFVLSGWISTKTRKLHITALLLTVISWLLLGLYKGYIGYCPITDWHWDVKRALGETDMPSSFVEYVVEQMTGINFPKKIMDAATGFGLVFGIVMSAVSNIKERTKAKEENPKMA